MLRTFASHSLKLFPSAFRFNGFLYRCGNTMSAKNPKMMNKCKRVAQPKEVAGGSSNEIIDDTKIAKMDGDAVDVDSSAVKVESSRAVKVESSAVKVESSAVKVESSAVKVESSAVDAESSAAEVADTEPKFRRKKVALLLSYSGVGYYGMQRQQQQVVSGTGEQVRTIEEELVSALLAAGAIEEAAYTELYRCKFERASRTDKGVSALRQTVSLKVALIPDLVRTVNDHLPPGIRVMGYKRATRAFDSKAACSSRTYGYLMPSFALAPLEHLTTDAYRITDDVRAHAQSVLDRYLGVHNFHNYTSGKQAYDRSAYRYIMEARCNEPFVVGDMEFVKITVRGQSFMLHQIRKMIGVLIAICKGWATTDIMDKAKQPSKLDIPKAPGLGLMLEHVHYDAYNKRYGDDGIHEPLTWEQHEEEIEAHARKYIYPNIIDTESTQRPLLQFLSDMLVVHDLGQARDLRYYSTHRSALGKAYLYLQYRTVQDRAARAADT